MKTDKNKKQLLKGVLAGTATLKELEASVQGKDKCVSLTMWEEVKPGYYQHPTTGEVRPESEAAGGFNMLVVKFHTDGTPMKRIARCESEIEF